MYDFEDDRVTVILAHETAGTGMFTELPPVRLTLTDLMAVRAILDRGEPI